MTNEFIGRKIREIRESKGLSISELARRFGTSHTTVSSWEKGRRPIHFGDLERVAEILESPVQHFLPEWYIDPRGLSPDLAQLVHRINALPHGEIRDQLIENIMREVEILKNALEIEED